MLYDVCMTTTSTDIRNTGKELDRENTIQVIRTNLRERSGKTWSVKGGRGTAWGWLTITAPPARQVGGCMSDADRSELASLLGMSVHHQGASVPPQSDYRTEYVDRSAGVTPERYGVPQWD